MGKKLLIFLLAWALASTAIAVSEHSNYQKALRKIQTLENNLTSLKYKINFTISERDYYRQKYLSILDDLVRLRLDLNHKNYTIYQLKRELSMFTEIPHNYYDHYFKKHNNTLKDLESFLENLTIPKMSHSKQIAYLEWALRNAGFRAHIAYGEIENEEKGYENMDFFVIVNLNNGTYFIDIVGNKTYIFDEELEIGKEEWEYEIINVYHDIYSVVDAVGNVSKFAWWNVIGYPPT